MNERTVSTVAQLRELYGYPSPDALAVKIVLKSLDRHHRAFIALSPFMMLASANAAGWPDESLRVNGTVAITTDLQTLTGLSADGKTPRSALRMHVEHAHFHCGKALIRSRLWAPPHMEENRKALPSLGKMLSEQGAGVTAADAEARIDASYTKRLWDEPPP